MESKNGVHVHEKRNLINISTYTVRDLNFIFENSQRGRTHVRRMYDTLHNKGEANNEGLWQKWTRTMNGTGGK